MLLKENGQIKLGDFGLSRSFDKNASILSTYAGTRSYMSPEIKSSQSYSYNTDCWYFILVIL